MVWQGFNDRLSCMDVEPITVTCGAGKWRNGCCSCPNCPSGRYRSSSGGVGEGSCSHCPAGRYGSGAGLTSSNCNGACAAGYYCTTGSTTATQNQCSPGRYSTGGAGSSACSGLCPAGRYCPAGSTSTSRLCNAGRYGNAGAASVSFSSVQACDATRRSHASFAVCSGRVLRAVPRRVLLSFGYRNAYK